MSGREPAFEFRPLAESDLPLLGDWLGRPHLREWWREQDLSLAALREKYLPRIAGSHAAHPFIASLDGEPHPGSHPVLDPGGRAEWSPRMAGPPDGPGGPAVMMVLGREHYTAWRKRCETEAR